MTAKPLTHAEIIRRLTAALGRSSSKPTVSIESMKDWTKVTVSVPASSGVQASAQAQTIYDDLIWKYNRPGFVPEADPEDVPFQ